MMWFLVGAGVVALALWVWDFYEGNDGGSWFTPSDDDWYGQR